ncbi:MAG: tetratricopeptide repeat protein [Puniceicoccales bacterium]|nr:tetratricopeptide repeat protein [Puniceicoccales bacterium]
MGRMFYGGAAAFLAGWLALGTWPQVAEARLRPLPSTQRQERIFLEKEITQRQEKFVLEKEVGTEFLDKAVPSRRVELRQLWRTVRQHRDGPEAPSALHRIGLINLEQHRLQAAFRRFQRILDNYPSYPRYGEVLELEFSVAERLMRGERGRIFGTLPGLRDRHGAIALFRKIVEQAPYDELSPMALMNIAKLSIEVKDPATAIGALETILDSYGHTAVAADALLLLAEVHRNRVIGPDYDQRAMREAGNAYQEFLLLYPNSPRVDEAELGLAMVKELQAKSLLRMGNFYYDDRNRPEAARPYYAQAIAAAPQSKTAAQARARLVDAAAGKPGWGTPLDWLIGPHRP